MNFERTPGDREAEIDSDRAASDGKWSELESPTGAMHPPEVTAIQEEARESIEERRLNDRREATQILANNGWPTGMIERAVDLLYPPDKPE